MIKLFRVFFLIAVAGLAIAVLLLAALPVLGPLYDKYLDPYWGYSQGKAALDKALNSCQPDELMVVMYFDKHGSEGAMLNFKTKKLSGAYSDPTITWSWQGRMTSFYSNVSFADSPPFTDEQIAKIRDLLGNLPAPSEAGWSNTVSYRDQCHVAFYQGDQLCVYHYSKGEARDQLDELCGLLGIPDRLP